MLGRYSSSACVLLIPLLLLAEATVAREGQAEYRNCTKTDLLGSWGQHAMKLPPESRLKIDPADPYFYRHQVFVFYENGSVRHITSTTQLTPSNYSVYESGPPTTTWTLHEDGGLLLDRKAVPETEWSHCSYRLAEMRDANGTVLMRPGDVMLVYFMGQGQDRHVAMIRLLRKLPTQ